MRMTLGLLADFANKTSDGKLNVLGAFNIIFADHFPAVHPEMKLVFRLEAHPAEVSDPKKLAIQLRDDRGTQILEVAGELKLIARPDSPAGEMINIDSILGINNLELKAAGAYEFIVMVNGDIKGTISLRAVERPSIRR